MDIFSAIKRDHQKLWDLFDRMERTAESDRETGHELFKEIKAALTQHTKAEQKVVYKLLAKQEPRLVEEAEQEHQQVDALLKELGKDPKFDEGWQAKLRELRRNVEHHVNMEETELFDRMREEIPQDDWEEMAERFETSKGTGAARKRASSKASYARR